MDKDIFSNLKMYINNIEKKDSQAPDNEYVYLIASHTNVPINNKIYKSDEFKEQQKTLTQPYNKKILLHHDRYSDPIGFVVEADFFSQQELSEAEKIVGSKIDMPENSDGFLFVKALIKDYKQLEKIKQGLYSNVSIGIDFDKVECGICGQDITFDYEHEHKIGCVYDGKTCYAIPRGIKIQEISVVNIPADDYAKILTKKATEDNTLNVNYNNGISGGAEMDGKDIEKKLEEIDALKTEFNDLKNSITKIEGIVDTIQTSVAPAIDFVVKQNETIRNGKIEKILELRTLVQLDQSETYKGKLLKKSDDELQEIYSELETVKQKIDQQNQKKEEKIVVENDTVKETPKEEKTSQVETETPIVSETDVLAKKTNVEKPIIKAEDQQQTEIKGKINTKTVLSQLGLINK